MFDVSKCPRGRCLPIVAIAGFSSLVLTGCEAPLNLQAVRDQSRQAIQRTDFFQAVARNDRIIAIAGNNGALLVSGDDGESWQRVTNTSDSSFIALDSCPDGRFIALSFDNQVWQGDRSGTHWVSHELPSQEQMMTLTCAPDGSWWTGGSFTTLQSSNDDGATWTETSLDEDAILTNIQFLDPDTGIATGEYGLVLKTLDGGKNWDYVGALPDEFYPHAAHFKSGDEGWVGGLNGFIYHTNNGGDTWQKQPTDTSAPVFGFINGEDGLFALGDNATVLELHGDQWQSIETPNQPLYLRDGLELNSHRLLLAGGRGLLLHLDLPLANLASNDRGN